MEKTAILNAIIMVGHSEIATSEVVKKAVAILEENDILTEIGLYDWTVKENYWNAVWPKPRSIWQEISRNNLTGGKKVKWKVEERCIQQNTPFWKNLFNKKEHDTIIEQEVVFQWKEEGLDVTQNVALPLVAGLGRLSARLAVAKSRQSQSGEGGEGGEGGKSGKGKSGKGKSGETGKEKILVAEIESAKADAEKAKADAEKAKAELLQFRKDVQNGILEEKAIQAEKAKTEAAYATVDEMKEQLGKMREERDAKEEALLSIANSLTKAKASSSKKELQAILEEIKAALEGTSSCTIVRQEMP